MPLLSDTIGGLHFAAIDFESAGAARGETDQPVQIGIAACSRLEDEPELWTSYIALGQELETHVSCCVGTRNRTGWVLLEK